MWESLKSSSANSGPAFSRRRRNKNDKVRGPRMTSKVVFMVKKKKKAYLRLKKVKSERGFEECSESRNKIKQGFRWSRRNHKIRLVIWIQ